MTESISKNLEVEEEEEKEDKTKFEDKSASRDRFKGQMEESESKDDHSFQRRLKGSQYEKRDDSQYSNSSGSNQLVVHLARKLLKAVSGGGNGVMETSNGRLRKRQRCRGRRSPHGVLIKDWLWLLDHLLKQFAKHRA